MAVKRKRVNVTLSWPLWELVGEVSEHTGQPKAGIITELLEEVRPALESTIEALRVVKERPHEAQRLMANFSAQAVSDLMQQQLELDKALDARTLEGRKARRAARAGAAK